MRTTHQIKAHKLQIQARENFKAKNKIKSTKKAQDRTKIQGGGILDASGLFGYFNIAVGEDLQADLTGYQRSATLLGALLKLNTTLRRRTVTEMQLMEFQRKGTKYLEERKINRNKSNKPTSKNNYTREEQNRTKAQGGGLLILSGLFDYFEIIVGEDLQTTLVGCQKSATLLGALVELRKLFEKREITHEQIKEFKDRGSKKLAECSNG